MTTPTNEPEETATHPDWRKAAMDWIKQTAPGGWIDDLRVKAKSLELRALSAEKERDELRAMLERVLKDYDRKRIADTLLEQQNWLARTSNRQEPTREHNETVAESAVAHSVFTVTREAARKLIIRTKLQPK